MTTRSPQIAGFERGARSSALTDNESSTRGDKGLGWARGPARLFPPDNGLCSAILPHFSRI